MLDLKIILRFIFKGELKKILDVLVEQIDLKIMYLEYINIHIYIFYFRFDIP